MSPSAKKSNKGRPTVFKPEFCAQVTKDMATGMTLTAWAGTVGVTRETVYAWVDTRPEFSYAVSVGRNLRQRYWEKRLKDCADNGSAVSGVMFALKNCCREDWTDIQRTELTGANGTALKFQEVETASKEQILSEIKRRQLQPTVVRN